MNEWNFKAAYRKTDGIIGLVDLSPSQQLRIAEYAQSLRVAAQSSVANPSFSKYFVRESIGLVGDEFVSAGNIEYGLCQALHGEESAVAAFRARYGRTADGNIVLGIVAGKQGALAAPCGNCRDIMMEDLGSDFEIVSGTTDGGLAIVANMGQYLFSEFQSLPIVDIPEDIVGKIGIAIRQGSLLVNDAYSPVHMHPERKYHALITTHENSFVGARDVMCDYHPIYALRDAVRQARRAHDPDVQSVIIVCEDFGGGAPCVMYKDRQHLAELNLQAELLHEQERDPLVFLATYDRHERITGAWITTVKEWIPFVFSPRNFGLEFIATLTNYFRNQRQL